MTTFNWQVVQMDRLTSDSFVVTCHYTVTATDGDYIASTYGTTSYTQVAGQTYIPYADLTEEQVMGWVQTYTPSWMWAEYTDKITAWITAQYTPSVVNPPLPWSVEPVDPVEPTPIEPIVAEVPVV